MIILSATTDKLSLISGAAGTLDVHVSWVDLSAGVATPGRTNTAITTATTTDILAAPAASTQRNAKTINVRNKHASASCDVTVQFNQNGTLFEFHKATLRAGEALQYSSAMGSWYLLAANIITPLMKVLSADDTGGQNIATVQPWFPTAGAVTVSADTTYQIDGILATTRAAGVTSHTTGLLFGGTATLTSIQYVAQIQVGDTDALLPISRVISRVATNTTVKAASTSSTETVTIKVDGIIRINVAGTLIPQFIYSAIPGGTPTIKANSHIRLDYLGTGGFTVNGTWS